MRKIRVGILGMGRSGRNIHAMTLQDLPEHYELIAIVDPLENRRIGAEQDFKCRSYADYKELLEQDDIDLIVNALPTSMHVSVSEEAMEAGKHVLCEKPLAASLKEVEYLDRAASRTGQTLAVFQQSRYSPAFVKMQEIINSGVLGRIVQISIYFNQFARRWDWQTLRQQGGGNLLNTGPHVIDQALQLFDSETMPKVTSFMDRANSSGDAEDFVKLILSGEGKPVIDLEMSSCDTYPRSTYSVQGTCGGLQGSPSELKWKFFKPEEAKEMPVDTTPLSDENGVPNYCNEQLIWYEQSWNAPEQPRRRMAQDYYLMMYETLINGKPLDVTLKQVQHQIAVIEACHKNS